MIPAQLWGMWHGVPNTDWLRSTRGEDRAMLVTARSTLAFERPNGEIVTPVAGLIFDGQSIPMLLWFALAMSPFTGKSREAAMIHDHLCKVQDRDYRDAHRVMYEGMRSRGMWFRGRLMYWGLLIGGSKW
jgi:hypothetical protein